MLTTSGPHVVDGSQALTAIGRTGIVISRLSLGTGFLGGLHEPVAEERFAATIAAALGHGINYLDTAPIYGLGVSEERLGDALAARPRDSYVLSTKIGRLLRGRQQSLPGAELDESYDGAWHGVPPRTIVVDFGYDATLRSLEESLQRLRLDRLDIVYIHDTFEEHHYRAAMDGAYRALDRLRSEGTIRAVGVGIGRTSVLLRFAQDGDFDCFLVAGRYTLLDQEGSSELLAVCRERAISIVLGGVFNSGILADPWRDDASFDYQPAAAARLEKARRLDHICRAHGIPLTAAALQFPLAEPAVATILMGASRPEEVIDNIRLAQMEIPPGLWADLRAEKLLPAEVATPPP